MKTCAALLVVSLSGCQTQAYQHYTDSLARIAEAQASVQREQTQMMIRLAEGSTNPSVALAAVLVLGMGGYGGKQQFQQPQPPQNEALAWAQVLIPSLVPITLGLWNYRNTKDASQNAATTAQASYAAIFGVAKEGFAASGSNITTTVTENTTTNTTTSLTASGNSVIGSGTAITAPLTPAQLLGFGP